MHKKTGTRVFEKIAVILVFISVSLACISISASALENDNMLVNGTGMYVTTGNSLLFHQGYELVFKGLSPSPDGDKVWIELLLNGETMDDTIIREGEHFTYIRNSKEIFNITVDTIYSGSYDGLVTFKPVYQYLDPALPEPDMTQDPGSVGNSKDSVDNSDSPNNNKTEDTSGFGAALFFLCMSAAIFIMRKNR